MADIPAQVIYEKKLSWAAARTDRWTPETDPGFSAPNRLAETWPNAEIKPRFLPI